MTDEQGLVFGAELKRLREREGLSATAFGELVGCSVAHISSLERGTRKPSPQLAERIANIFDLTVEDMLTPNDDKVQDFRKKYGAVLKEHREAKGLPISAVAGALGIEPYIYKEYEQGVASITEREMNMLGRLLDIGKKPEVIETKVIVEVPAEIPTEICDIILGHIRDMQVGEDEQKKVWRYFSNAKMDAEERRLFGKGCE